MLNRECLQNKTYHFVIGTVLALFTIGFSLILGVAILPIIGFVFAIPIASAAIYFLSKPRSKECSISTG